MISRKEFIIKSLSLIAGAITLPALLTNCGGEAGNKLAVDACNDLSVLDETEIKKREGLKYVSQAPDKTRNCANCRFWKASAREGDCGGCQLFAGKVHPEGWCQSWFARES